MSSEPSFCEPVAGGFPAGEILAVVECYPALIIRLHQSSEAEKCDEEKLFHVQYH